MRPIHKVNIEMHIGDIDLSQDRISQYKFIMFLGDNVIIDKDTNTVVENTNGKFLFIPFDINDNGENEYDHIDYVFEMKRKYDIRRPEKEHAKSYDERLKGKGILFEYEPYYKLMEMGISFTYNLRTPNAILEDGEENSIRFYRSKEYKMSNEAQSRLQCLFEKEEYTIYVCVQISDFLPQIQAIQEENRDDFVIEAEGGISTIICFSHRKMGLSGREFTVLMNELDSLKPTKKSTNLNPVGIYNDWDDWWK